MKGSCLCGSVIIDAPDRQQVNVCHCSMCRRWSGGPLHAVRAGQTVAITGADRLTVFKSSDWAERAFCSQCGTHLYYKLLPTNEYILPAGLFQDGTQFELHQEIFIDNKPTYYAFANQTQQLTQADLVAIYATGRTLTGY